MHSAILAHKRESECEKLLVCKEGFQYTIIRKVWNLLFQHIQYPLELMSTATCACQKEGESAESSHASLHCSSIELYSGIVAEVMERLSGW